MNINEKVIDFKRYLAKDNPLTGKLYFGPFNHEIDEGFESACKTVEKKIAEAIDNQSVIGQLWTKNGFNEKADLKDLDNSLKLIARAQATLETLDAQMQDGQNDIPNVFRFMNTPPGYLEEPDPDQSQRQGITDLNLPSMHSLLGDVNDLNMDDRVLKMIDLMSDKEI